MPDRKPDRGPRRGRRAAALVLVAALTTSGLAGCATSKPRGSTSPAPGADDPFPASLSGRGEPRAGRDQRSDVAPVAASGLLAGQIVDATGRPVPGAAIQVAQADTQEKPLEVQAREQGYFFIPGLEPGKPYQLTVRRKDGERTLVGRAEVRPPDPRILIELREDRAPSSGPLRGRAGPGRTAAPTNNVPVPAEPTWTEGGPGASTAFPAVPPPAPAPAPLSGPPATIGPAIRPAPLAPPPASPPPSLENIAGQSRPGPPLATIPPPQPFVPQPTEPAPPLPEPPSASVPAVRVPMCQIQGNRVENFALNDLDGHPWEFRRHHGKLVLLDFWGTWCVYCLKAIPHVRELQRHYGAQGLEVVGIACEQPPRPGLQDRRADLVRDVAQKMGINYRLLLSNGFHQCPVQAQFQIREFPTLILLDDTGTILWRGHAGLTMRGGREIDEMVELESIIRRRLGTR